MDILRKVRDLEAKISSRVDRTVGDFVQSGTREPLEIVHAIVEAAGRRRSRRAAAAGACFPSMPSG